VSPSKPGDEEQIDSTKIQNKNTLDLIDPIFAQALNASSI